MKLRVPSFSLLFVGSLALHLGGCAGRVTPDGSGAASSDSNAPVSNDPQRAANEADGGSGGPFADPSNVCVNNVWQPLAGVSTPEGVYLELRTFVNGAVVVSSLGQPCSGAGAAQMECEASLSGLEQQADATQDNWTPT